MPVFKINVEKYETGVILHEAENKEEVKEYIENRTSDELEIHWVATQIKIHKRLDDIKEAAIAPIEEV